MSTINYDKTAHELAMAMIQALDDAGPGSDQPPFPYLPALSEDDDSGDKYYLGICQQARAWIANNVDGGRDAECVIRRWNHAFGLAAAEFCSKHWAKDGGAMNPDSYPINFYGANEFESHALEQTLWSGGQRARRRELIGMVEARLAAVVENK